MICHLLISSPSATFSPTSSAPAMPVSLLIIKETHMLLPQALCTCCSFSLEYSSSNICLAVSLTSSRSNFSFLDEPSLSSLHKSATLNLLYFLQHVFLMCFTLTNVNSKRAGTWSFLLSGMPLSPSS